MKLPKTLACLFLMGPLGYSLAAPVATGCEGKRQDIEKQIDYAREFSNYHRIAGLQKALSELNTHCTDAGLRAERESNIRKKERKVEERRQELAEARADGREKKIRNKLQKLEEAQDELAEARSMLNK